MSAELLTKLTPSSVNLERVGSGGVPDINRYDVAAALAYGSLPTLAYHYGLSKYCMDAKASSNVLKTISEKIQLTIKMEGWPDEEGRSSKLAKLVLLESGHGITCTGCNGLGLIQFTEKSGRNHASSTECKKCEGSGVGQLSERKKAEIAGIPKSSWSRGWNERMSIFYEEINILDHVVSKHLGSQLF